MSKGLDSKIIKEKDRLLHFTLNNIINGKFEFKKGNTLASFAEALLVNYDCMFLGSK